MFGIPRPCILLGAMIMLAGLDFVGALLAKQWAERGSRPAFALGLMTFVILFIFYALSLRTAELSVVTMGWVVMLQVGLILIDRLHYDVSISTDKWIAISLVLILQAYLIFDPFASTSS